jgi:hypothetical protein
MHVLTQPALVMSHGGGTFNGADAAGRGAGAAATATGSGAAVTVDATAEAEPAVPAGSVLPLQPPTASSIPPVKSGNTGAQTHPSTLANRTNITASLQKNPVAANDADRDCERYTD